ncbi:hypothetical protein ABPG72_022362 [Tetrahymena utriculariae]
MSEPIFFYNQNKDPDPNQKNHFFLTQIQTLLLCILVTGLMQLANHLSIYLIYCCPIFFFLAFLQYCLCWRPKKDMTVCFNIYNCIMFIVCFPIFYGVFFGVFHPTAKLEFTKVEDCQIIGQLTDWIEHFEKYSILYVNFKYQGQQYLGQTCASDQNQGKVASPIYPYLFYYKYDVFPCGSDNKDYTDTNDSRLLLQNQNQEVNLNQRLLAVGGGGGGSGTGSRSSSGGGSSGQNSNNHSGEESNGASQEQGNSEQNGSSGSGCSRSYLWSKVKLASWLCLPHNFNVEQYMKPQACYFQFFSGQNAESNGLNRSAMKDQYNFPLISYEPQAYYRQIDLIVLILFSYYNWIMSFNSIFQYTSNAMLKRFRKINRVSSEINEQNQQNLNKIQCNNINADQQIQNAYIINEAISQQEYQKDFVKSQFQNQYQLNEEQFNQLQTQSQSNQVIPMVYINNNIQQNDINQNVANYQNNPLL